MNRKMLFPTLAVMVLATVSAPSAFALGTDNDGDRLPDNAEVIACSSGAVAAAINTAGQGKIWCDGDIEYDLAQSFQLVTGAAPSGDADNDGFPATVTLTVQEFTFDPENAAIVYPSGTTYIVQTVDPQDGNPDFPVASRIVLAKAVPVDATVGPDPDNDGVPTSVTIKEQDLTLDRRVVPQVERSNDQYLTVPVDPAPNSAPTDGVDGDRDRVLDATEPTICFVQFDALTEDGTCDATKTNYTPPGVGVPPINPGIIVGRVGDIADELTREIGIVIHDPFGFA